MRVEPDRAAEDSNRDSYADDFAVIPDDEAVIALTNAMSEEGYYVKHVIENPPRSGKRANDCSATGKSRAGGMSVSTPSNSTSS